MHDVERAELRIGARERSRNDGEILGDVVRDGERRQRAARHQHLLAGLDDLDELGGIRVEVDHVAGLFGRLGAGIHRYRDVGLRERRRIVGAVARHGHQASLRLVLADELELRLGRRLGEKVIDARLGRDRRRRQTVVAGDHDGLDAHVPQVGESFLDAALDDVLELDHAEHARAFRDHQRRAALPRDALHRFLDRGGTLRAERLDVLDDGIRRALADLAIADVDTAHARDGGERHETRAERTQVALAQIEALLREHDDAASLGRFVRERCELRGIGELLLGHAGCRQELRGLPVAERDGAGLVEEQHVDVAGRLDGAARGRDDVRLHHAAHARDADRRQQARRWSSG